MRARQAYTANFLAQVYAWGQNRSEHQTLDNKDPCKMIEVQTFMIRMAYTQVWDDEWLKKRNLDGFLRLPMSEESFDVPDELKTAMKNVYYNFKGVGQADRTHVK